MKLRTATSLALFLLTAARPTPLLAQLTSTGYKLSITSGSGALGTSTNARLYSDLPGAMVQRTTSAANDLFTGYMGCIASSPQETLKYVTAPTNFSLIAFPLKRTASGPTTVLAALGGYDIKAWRLGHFDTANNKYVEPGSGLTAISEGAGYWLITENATSGIRDIGLPQKEVPFLGTNTEYPLANAPSAAPGWNQMGNPFPYPIDLSHVWVTDGVFNGPVNDGGNTITQQTVKVWNSTTGQYADATVINGRQGFWVKKLSSNPVHVLFQSGASASGTPSPNLTAGGTSTSARAPVALGIKPQAAQWAVSLTAREGERVSEPMVIGAADVPAGQWNTMCDALAPPPPDMELLTLRQTRRDWGRLSGDYTRVIQRSADHMSWDFVVSGAQAPGEMALEVAAENLPSGTRLWMTDLVSGTTQEIAPGGTVTLPAYGGDRGYRVEAVASGAQQPVAILRQGFVRASPNPFRSGSGLTFGLARSGDLSLEIFDLQGRRVRSLERRGLSPGEHVLVWDGRDGDGRAAGSGVYLARWRAGGESGAIRLVKVE